MHILFRNLSQDLFLTIRLHAFVEQDLEGGMVIPMMMTISNYEPWSFLSLDTLKLV